MLKQRTKTKILFCYAHPDDLVLSCGGTVAKLCKEAYDVRALEVTDGTLSNNKLSKERINESAQSAKLLDYRVDQLSFPDGRVQYDIDLVSRIESYLNAFKPRVVVTHFPQILGRGHQDHQAVASAVLNCARRASFVKYILFSEPVSSFDDFSPNVFVDITDLFELKMKAIEKHQSESHKYYISRKTVSVRAQFWRELAVPEKSQQEGYYEAFCLVKGVVTDFFK
jgi:LmbE family N-acetylglucosaminyl deacetylase